MEVSDGFRNTVRQLYGNYMPIEQIACVFKLTVEEVEEILEIRNVKEDPTL